MPHQCVRCNKFYDDGAQEILSGCSCGAKVFFFVRKEKMKQMEETIAAIQNLTIDEKKEMETDVFNLMEVDPEEAGPVVLDLEAVRSLEPGKFELDLVRLFKKDPLIFKIGEGKYIIDLNSVFNSK